MDFLNRQIVYELLGDIVSRLGGGGRGDFRVTSVHRASKRDQWTLVGPVLFVRNLLNESCPQVGSACFSSRTRTRNW